MKNTILLSFFLLLIIAEGLRAQTWKWAKKLESIGTATDQVVVKGVDVDLNGNTYVTGYYTGQLNLATGNRQDGFVAKFNPAGTLLWSYTFGGGGSDAGNAISVMTHSTDTAFFITGYVQYNEPTPVIFNGSTGSMSLPSAVTCASVTPPNNVFFRYGLSPKQAFVGKIRFDGAVLWVRPIYSISCFDSEGLGISASYKYTWPGYSGTYERNVYVTGYFEGNTASFLGASSCSFTSISGNVLNKTAFVAKFAGQSNGNIMWARSLAVPGNTNAASVGKSVQLDYSTATVTNGNAGVFITGDYQSAVSINGNTLTNSGSDTRVYVASLSTGMGSSAWVKEIYAAGSGANATARAISCRQGSGSSNDELFVLGDFSGSSIAVGTATPSSNGGLRDIFLGKFAKSTGTEVVIIADGGSDNQYAGGMDINGDGTGSSELFVCGSFSNSVAFNGGASFSPIGTPADQFMVKYSTIPSYLCATHWDAGMNLNGETLNACNIAASKQSTNGAAYIGGMFFNGESPSFNPIAALNTTDSLSGFVTQWLCCDCPPPIIDVTRSTNSLTAVVSFTFSNCNNPNPVFLKYDKGLGTPTVVPILWGTLTYPVSNLDPTSTYTWSTLNSCQAVSNTVSARVSSNSHPGISNSKFNLYPNPSQTSIYIESGENGNVEFYNVLGELVKTKPLTSSKTEVDVSDLPNGNYLCKFISQSNAIITQKIQVTH